MQINNPRTTEEIVIKAACIHFGLEVQDFTESKSQDQNFTYQRFIAIYLIRESTLLSYEKISQMFCRKDNAMKYSYKQISGLEAIKDRRTMADLREIKLIIDIFTNQKKQQYA